MPDGSASAQISVAVRAALEPAARYVALVTQSNPLGSARQLLARPDVSAVLADALGQAWAAVAEIVRGQWGDAPASPVLAHLLADVGRQYGSPGHLSALVRQAHASVPPRGFVPGQTPPGAHPSADAAAERATAVRDAIFGFARQVSLRSKLTAAFAATAARSAAVLAEARSREAAGKTVFKRWLSRRDGKACHWCQNLDGVTISPDDSFLPYLGGPADLSGHGRLTQPPKPYRGELQGPPLHPNCRCRLMVVTEAGPARPEPPPGPAMFTAAQIRAMPEAKYQGLLAFIRAAVHELGQLLRRLVSAS